MLFRNSFVRSLAALLVHIVMSDTIRLIGNDKRLNLVAVRRHPRLIDACMRLILEMAFVQEIDQRCGSYIRERHA